MARYNELHYKGYFNHKQPLDVMEEIKITGTGIADKKNNSTFASPF